MSAGEKAKTKSEQAKGKAKEVAGMLLIPNDQSYDRRTCEVDIKDGGGMHPPEPPSRGEQL
ncbi:hypothetical protein [Streptomyces sp. MK5]|uniref:hypothetical protein n=1 Tax=Streptomyces sp. MK5 TaxID=3064253 RepID=UPI0027417396|nr:hypothetical protein [Streptomyces sp. MK5]